MMLCKVWKGVEQNSAYNPAPGNLNNFKFSFSSQEKNYG